jgi:hypothetical protein
VRPRYGGGGRGETGSVEEAYPPPPPRARAQKRDETQPLPRKVADMRASRLRRFDIIVIGD